MTAIARDAWNFQGYITSDCGATVNVRVDMHSIFLFFFSFFFEPCGRRRALPLLALHLCGRCAFVFQPPLALFSPVTLSTSSPSPPPPPPPPPSLSSADAVSDVYYSHNYTKTPEETCAVTLEVRPLPCLLPLSVVKFCLFVDVFPALCWCEQCLEEGHPMRPGFAAHLLPVRFACAPLFSFTTHPKMPLTNKHPPHTNIYAHTYVRVCAAQAGMDLDCGSFLSSNLPSAVSKGVVSEADLDAALEDLFGVQMRLGLFDPPEQQPYMQYNYTDKLNTPAHQQLALDGARQSLVLLKNSGNRVLPFPTAPKSVAFIGPNADAQDTMLGNYQGNPPFIVSPVQGAKAYSSAVSYVLGCDVACDSTAGFADAIAAAKASDLVVVIVGLDQGQVRAPLSVCVRPKAGVSLRTCTRGHTHPHTRAYVTTRTCAHTLCAGERRQRPREHHAARLPGSAGGAGRCGGRGADCRGGDDRRRRRPHGHQEQRQGRRHPLVRLPRPGRRPGHRGRALGRRQPRCALSLCCPAALAACGPRACLSKIFQRWPRRIRSRSFCPTPTSDLARSLSIFV